MKIPRSARISGEYQKAISEVIAGPLKNKYPDLKGIISVTKADVASDLKNATIYVSILASNNEESLKTYEIIRNNAGLIRKELAHMMEMRTVPYLDIRLDESFEYGSRIDSLLKQIEKKGE